LGITQEPAAYALQYLINAQNDDGSWALAGDVGRVQTTALAMHALWQYRHVYDVESPLQAAEDFLLAQQEGQLWGDTESSALALYALVSRAVDRTSLQQALDALQNRQNPDGDFEQDVYVTALALRVLSAASRPAEDITSLTGTLVDAQSGQPLAGVDIALAGSESRQLVTDSDGGFFCQSTDARPLPAFHEQRRVQHPGAQHGPANR
jgi:squalene cyclase